MTRRGRGGGYHRALAAAASMLVLTTGLAAPAQAPAASTLVVTPRPISSFAYAGHTVGWATPPCSFGASPRARFRVMDILTGRVVGFTSTGAGCGIVEAVTDRRVVNMAAVEATSDWLETATLNRRRLVRFQTVDYSAAPGTNHGAVATDGRTFVYAVWSFDFQNPTTCAANGTGCDLVVTGGGLRRLAGPPPARRIPGAPPARLVSVSGGLVALQPYVLGSRFRTGDVQVRDVSTGALVSTFSTANAIVGIALHGNMLAVMTRATTGARRVQFRSASSGALLSSFRVSRTAGNRVDLSGRGLLYRVGPDLFVLDPSGGKRVAVRIARRRPVFWEIEGRRVVWAVNRARHGRIVTRLVP